MILFYVYGEYLSIFNKLSFAFTTSLMSILEYGISLYRIKLRYKYYLYQNILITIGYIIGVLLFIKFHYWSLIFMTGNIFGIIFFLFKSGILHESFKVSNNFVNIMKQLINISIGHVLSSIVSNLDRFLIPIVMSVSYLPAFFSANTLSKMFSLIMGPLSDVLLSHLSKSNIKWNRHKLNFITLVLTLIGVALIIPSYFISVLIIKILYHNIFYGYSNMNFIILFSCIATCLFEAWNIINTIYLLCLKSKFQVFINSFFLISYLFLSIIFSIKWSLIGYTSGYALSIILSFIVSIIVSNIKFLWK